MLTEACAGSGPEYAAQLADARKCFARVSETIPVLYCCGGADVSPAAVAWRPGGAALVAPLRDSRSYILKLR